MSIAWSSDFSYKYYRKLLETIREHYSLYLMSEAEHILNIDSERPKLILRHDVDLDLSCAVALAEIENELGISACYMVLSDSPFYFLDDISSKNHLNTLLELGHEIGLHFDLNGFISQSILSGVDFDSEELSLNPLFDRILHDIKLLEEVTSAPIESISFHRPSPESLNGPFRIHGIINAYSAELLDYYLSDSKGRWREGEPLKSLESPKKPLLQLLIHPIWWGTTHMKAKDRLQWFFESRTPHFSNKQRISFDNEIFRHAGLSRSGRIELETIE